MCVIMLKPYKQKLPEDVIDRGAYLNNDGTGIYVFRDGEFKIVKNLYYEKVRQFVMKHNREDTFMVIHHRIKTHGALTKSNVHPFHIKDGWFLFHNGILSGFPGTKEESDTMMLASYLADFFKVGTNMEHLFDLIESFDETSKLLVVRKDKYHIANQSGGTWRYGCWFSNTGPLPYKYTNYHSRYRYNHWDYRPVMVDGQKWIWDDCKKDWRPVDDYYDDDPFWINHRIPARINPVNRGNMALPTNTTSPIVTNPFTKRTHPGHQGYADGDLHLVFLYDRHQPDYDFTWFLTHKKSHIIHAPATTVNSYPMINLDGVFTVLDKAGHGHRLRGTALMVDAETLQNFDVMYGSPGYMVRIPTPISFEDTYSHAKTRRYRDAWIYVNANSDSMNVPPYDLCLKEYSKHAVNALDHKSIYFTFNEEDAV